MSKKRETCLEFHDPVPDFQTREGPLRKFLVTEPSLTLPKLRNTITGKEKVIVTIMMVVTCFIRLRNLSKPDSVVFDEVHFGGFASKYITGTFFMDVHPPLVKMLFACIASISGFKGDFLFDHIGDKFPKDVPYFMIRLFAASLGSLTVLLMYFTLRMSGVKIVIALLASLCFAMENSYVTISRYILLDAPLIFFIAGAVYSFKRFEIYPSNSLRSYKSLLATGISLGLALSSKWVGLFTIIWVGLICIWRLWFQIGDLTRPLSHTMKQATAKIIFLLVVPFILYVTFFAFHFNTLTNYSDGAGFFSSEFRTTLKGNNVPSNISADVGVGSIVTIRHVDTMGGYLHSHEHLYESGSKQQQITLYSHLDDNNKWYVELYNETNVQLTEFKGLEDGTKIRLKHLVTSRRLHSHDHKPPVSESSDWQKEVSAYGFENFEGDANDDWIIEIDQKSSTPGDAQKRIIAIETKFRLKHAMMGCYLFSHEVKLPKWGFEQQEVTCASQGKPNKALWIVESNENNLLPPDSRVVSYKTPSFWDKFIESHQKMWVINKNLNDPHFYQSEPYSWPLLERGISYWASEHRQIYFLGNAILWWSVSLFVILFSILVVVELLVWQSGKTLSQDSKVWNFHFQVIHYLLGYAIHYIPSFLMGRQLFLHHYLPAYYFGILAFAHALDILVSYIFRRKQIIGYIVVIAFVTSVARFYLTYSPLIYGDPWTKDLCNKSQWLSGWDYTCSDFLDTYKDYKELVISSQHLVSVAPSKTLAAEADSQPTNNIGSAQPSHQHKNQNAYDVNQIINDPNPKKFIDQFGNELSEEDAMEILFEKGGQIKSVEKSVQPKNINTLGANLV